MVQISQNTETEEAKTVICPNCRTQIPLVKFFDKDAYHCSVCVFERILLDGTVQTCLMDMKTGALRWKDV